MKKKFRDQEKLLLSNEDLRFATPDIVADYRASRLKCNAIADFGCGIGGQSMAFAKTCKKVYAIDNDESKLENAKRNSEVRGLKNIGFINADFLDEKLKNKIKDADIIFCDPPRPAEEKERNIGSVAPIIEKILEIYPEKDFAIEIPPQITPEKIKYECEKEYLSLDFALNRLTLYFKKLKKCDVSVVSLPEKFRIENDGNKKELESNECLSYIYEVDAAIIKAGLLGNLAVSIKYTLFLYQKNKKTILTSEHKIKNPFLRGYKVIGKSNNEINSIIDALKKNNIGKITLRMQINPEEFWAYKNRIEKNLSGEKRAQLFVFGKEAVVCEEI
jgi:SAM-dependent methyltransferase